MADKKDVFVEILKNLPAIVPAVVAFLDGRYQWFPLNPLLHRGLVPMVAILSILAFVVAYLVVRQGRKAWPAVVCLLLTVGLSVAVVVLIQNNAGLQVETATTFVKTVYVLVFTSLGATFGCAMALMPPTTPGT